MSNSEEDGYEWINGVNRVIDEIGIAGMTVLMSIVMLIWALLDGDSGSFWEILFATPIIGFGTAFIITIGWGILSGLGKIFQTAIIIFLIAAFLEGTGIIDLP